MKMRPLLLAALLLPMVAFAEDVLKEPYSIIITYTAKDGTAVSSEAINLMRRNVTLPLNVGGNTTWLASITFNSSEALKGKGPADENLDRIYITISNPLPPIMKEGTSTVNYITLFDGEFKLQLGKKMNVYKTPNYSVDVTVIPPSETAK